jgi:hypothetical protein
VRRRIATLASVASQLTTMDRDGRPKTRASPLVRSGHAEQHLDRRRLAGAVSAQKAETEPGGTARFNPRTGSTLA